MDGRSYITALFDDRQAAAGGIQTLAAQGVLPDEVCAAIADVRDLIDFCNETGAIPCEGPVAPQLQEVGVSVERAADAERQIASGRVMLLLPAAFHADERLHALREAGADALAEPSDETVRIPLHAEKLKVSKRYVSDAEVRIRKIVRSVTQHIDVPLTREELVVVRTSPGEEPEVLRIPTKHEEVDLQKRMVVTNEVTIRRESAESVAHISEPLRHEVLEVHHVDCSTGDRTSTFAATTEGKSSPLDLKRRRL